MSLVVGQCLQDVHLIKKKINLIITRCSFDKKENKPNYYRGKYCIEKLCKKLKENAMKIINYEENKMIPLTYEENQFYKSVS